MSLDYQVILSGLDITDWVIEKPNIVYQKNQLGELSEIPNADIIVDNSTHLFTPYHSQSIIQDVRERSIVIYEDTMLIFEGYLRHSLINTTDTTAMLQCTARINQIIGSIMTPAIDDTIQSFSEISEYIYTLYNIEIDKTSYYRSHKKQQELGLLGWINHNVDHSSSVMEIQQLLANAGFSRHYFISNKAYMEFIDPFEDTISFHTFTDDDIISIENYQPLEKVPYDGYLVQTAAGKAEKIGLNMAPSLDCGLTSPVIMATPAGGLYWGDYNLELSNKTQSEITLRLVKDTEAFWLGMTSVFTIQSTTEGIEETFLVTSIDKSNDIFVIVRGETV